MLSSHIERNSGNVAVSCTVQDAAILLNGRANPRCSAIEPNALEMTNLANRESGKRSQPQQCVVGKHVKML